MYELHTISYRDFSSRRSRSLSVRNHTPKFTHISNPYDNFFFSLLLYNSFVSRFSVHILRFSSSFCSVRATQIQKPKCTSSDLRVLQFSFSISLDSAWSILVCTTHTKLKEILSIFHTHNQNCLIHSVYFH